MHRLDDDGDETSNPVFDQAVRVSFLKYLDLSGNLESLRQAGMEYRDTLSVSDKTDNTPPSFTFTVELDLLQITDISDEVSLLILEQPLLAQRLLRDVVHCSLVTLCSVPYVTMDQVQVVLRVHTLPAEQALRATGSRRPDTVGRAARKLLLLQGVITAITPPTKYTRSAVFRCPNLLCPGAAGRRFWGLAAAVRKCRFCGSIPDETPRARDVGDQALAIMVDPGALRPQDVAAVNHPVFIRFTDDLTQRLELGCRYDVVVLTGSGADLELEAWGVRPWQNRAQRRFESGLRSDPLPTAIQDIWIQSTAEADSPWAFAVAMALQLGGGRYPSHAFLHLKLGIMLSLASQGLDHPPVALLALGQDPAGQTLLWRCLRLASRGLSVAGPAPALSEAATGSVRQARQGPGQWPGTGPGPSHSTPALPSASALMSRCRAAASTWHSAGPLILAQGGVCLLGCWDKWNRSAAALGIKAALESGRAILETRGATGSQLPGTGPSVPLKCAVWTYWSPGNKSADTSTLRTLLNTLGAPVLADAGCDIEDICVHLLLQAQGKQLTQHVVSECEMKGFLALVNAQPVSLTDEASCLIQDYFVASRRVRPNCLPVTAVSTMAAMAEAVARISLRIEATWADVVLVVWMYEVAVTALFGPCLISPLPDDCMLPLHSKDLTNQMDRRLNSMKVWLENFTKSILLSSLRVQHDL